MTEAESGERRQPALSAAKTKRPATLLRIKDWTLDLDRGQLFTGNGAQELTPQLCRLLEVFMRNPEQVLDRKFLMKEVWETDYFRDTRTLEVHVCWLRKKLEDNPHHPRYLRTVRGVGYRLSLAE